MLICLKTFSNDLNVLTRLFNRCVLIISHAVSNTARETNDMLLHREANNASMLSPTKHEMGNVRLQEIPSGNDSGHGTKKRYFESALEPLNMLQTRKATVLLFIAQTENY